MSSCDLLSFFELLIFTTTENPFGFPDCRCDLLSFFELLIFTTTKRLQGMGGFSLWFAFILWTTDIYNNIRTLRARFGRVVICFHSLNYWYLQQPSIELMQWFLCCDLLSFFELLIFTTTTFQKNQYYFPLWFAFILWTTDIYNNKYENFSIKNKVVICFHSLNYWYLQQPF